MALEALTCPKCNGEVNLDKDQEYGYCKYCGTKVQNNNFKKVIVKGKIKIDESEKLERILYNARKARENEDWEETENFYGQFLEYNSQDLEANFYFLYSKMAQSLLNYEFVKRKKAFEILIKYVSKLSKNISNIDDDILDLIKTFSYSIEKIRDYDFVSNKRKIYSGLATTTDSNETIFLINSLESSFVDFLDKIIYKFIKNGMPKQFIISIYSMEIVHCQNIGNNVSFSNVNQWKEKVRNIYEKIHLLDNSYIIPSTTGINYKINSKKIVIYIILGCLISYVFYLIFMFFYAITL